MIMELLQMQVEYVYHQWQVFDLNKERHIRVMAMNKQYKPEKHLAKHYNLYEMIELKKIYVHIFSSS
jgi:hypothetical protein